MVTVDDERGRRERLVRASAGVALGTLLSRVTGLLRVAALVYAIGRASLADAYNLANTTPNIVYELLLGGVLTATLVPLFVEHVERRDDRSGNAVMTATMLILVVLTGIAMVAAPWIARLYSIDAEGAGREAQLEVMTFLIRCFLPQMCFYGLTALASAMLNARRRYAAAAYAPVLNNVVVISVLLAFVRVTDGPQSAWTDVDAVRGDTGLLLLLGLGTTAGIAATALALLPALARAGAHLRFVADWRSPAIRTLVRLSGWTAGYVVANQVALLFVLVLASTGDTGNVSAYQYAFIFFQLPHGLFAVSIMTTTTPELARHAGAGDRAGMQRDFSTGLRLLVLAVLPAAVALAVLAQPAVAILANGAFGTDDAGVTADVLQILAVGLLPFSVYLYTLRVFYAQQDTRTPFLVNAFENGLNIALAAALFPALGVQGLAYAYAAAYLAAAAVALAVAGRRIGSAVDGRARTTMLRAAAGVAALALVAAPIAGLIGRDSTGAALAATVAGAVAGGLAYVGVLAALGVDELRSLVAVVRRGRTTAPDV